jgi:pimeloyl-ACP methyl ester carboxylesterase
MRGDLRLWWTEYGDPAGRPVVLLHGLLFASANQQRVAQALPRHRVLLLDLHGHGRSSQPDDRSRYTWAELVADVVGLLDHLRVERAVVGGLSLGANVALAAALTEPERVDGLVLEMPVLARGTRFARPAFATLAQGYSALGPLLSPVTYAIRRSGAPAPSCPLPSCRW